MSEICGIISNCDLLPDQIAALKVMQNELEKSSRGSQSQNIILPWVGITITTHHKNDYYYINSSKEKDLYFAYIGNDQNSHYVEESSNYEQWYSFDKSKSVNKLLPHFLSCMIHSDGSRRVEIMVDQFGFIPLYYAFQNNILIFCSKLDPLLKSGIVSWNLNFNAIFDFFVFEHVTREKTFADTVSIMKPGSILRYKNGTIHNFIYYDALYDRITDDQNTLDSASDFLYELLSKNVGAAIANHSKVAITLSGGFDSRALLGCALRYGKDLVCYTFGIPGAHDILYAQKITKMCGIRHEVVYATGDYLTKWFDYGLYNTSGMVSCNHYHILHLADLLSKEADVVIDGFGGDILTGAHLKKKMFISRSKEQAEGLVFKQRAVCFKNTKSLQSIFDNNLFNSVYYDPLETIRFYMDQLRDNQFWYGCHLFDLYERQRRFIQFGAHNLRPFVDVKTPFFSTDIVSFLFKQSPKYLANQKCYKNMYIKHLPALARLPDTARGVPISWPENIRNSKYIYRGLCRKLPESLQNIFLKFRKATDYKKWYRTTLRSFVEDKLVLSYKEYEEIINHKEVENIVREHMEGKKDNSTEIGCLLTFTSWYSSMKKYIND